MKLSQVVADMIDPALAWLPAHMNSPQARVMLLAIGLQESRFEYRRQLGNGPARSFWQFERGTAASRGGVWGIFLHAQSRDLLRDACAAHSVAFEPRAIWTAIEHNDVLACICARLLLWTDAQRLPALGDEAGAWELYAERTWRPGRPHHETWAGFYAAALAEVTQ